MDTRRLPLSIISLLIGSGITVFAVTTIYNDVIKQPSIKIAFDNPVSINSSSLMLKLHVYNAGWTSANNVSIVLHSVTNISYFPSSLNFTEDTDDIKIENDEPNKLIIGAPRLVGSGGEIALSLILVPQPTLGSQLFPVYPWFEPLLDGNFAVIVAYENGNIFSVYNLDKDGISQTTGTTDLMVIELVLLGVFILTIFYFIPQIVGLVKKLTRRAFRFSVYYRIINEASTVLEKLKENPGSTRIFSADLIDYKELSPDTKYFFYDYTDYRLISEFYEGLRKRDSDLSAETVYLSADEHNIECYMKALAVLQNIRWSKYGVVTNITRRMDIIATFLSIFPGIGHMALQQLKRGLYILLLFVITVIGVLITVSYSLPVMIPSILIGEELNQELGTFLDIIIIPVVAIWFAIYVWQIIDLRRFIKFIKKVNSYVDS